MGADGEGGVEEEDAAARPRLEVAVLGRDEARHVGGELLVHVLQRRRRRDALAHGEAEAVRLVVVVVRVLAEDHHAHRVQGREVERIEDVGEGRKDCAACEKDRNDEHNRRGGKP